jgi:hypothetical protein
MPGSQSVCVGGGACVCAGACSVRCSKYECVSKGLVSNIRVQNCAELIFRAKMLNGPYIVAEGLAAGVPLYVFNRCASVYAVSCGVSASKQSVRIYMYVCLSVCGRLYVCSIVIYVCKYVMYVCARPFAQCFWGVWVISCTPTMSTSDPSPMPIGLVKLFNVWPGCAMGG